MKPIRRGRARAMNWCCVIGVYVLVLYDSKRAFLAICSKIKVQRQPVQGPSCWSRSCLALSGASVAGAHIETLVSRGLVAPIGAPGTASATIGFAGGSGFRRRRSQSSFGRLSSGANGDDAAEEGLGLGEAAEGGEVEAMRLGGRDGCGATVNANGGGGAGCNGPIQCGVDKIAQLPSEIKNDLMTFFGSLASALLLRGFFVEPRIIPSISMYPTFDIGERFAVEKVSHTLRGFKRRDVIVFHPPQAFVQIVDGDRNHMSALVKRIVGLDGDVIEVKQGGTLYVNGVAQVETFTSEAAKYEFGPEIVPEGCVFVLGDNRNDSLDGHVWGFLPKTNIIGRAVFKFWPPGKIGRVAVSLP
eukprot:TRINITY_DN32467_c0_g1_i1.p1 TRINITY_DN32467_c0_g1~~TRINITY_DN32467_c0_g1_i1.p1  ORF type:complete len:358 (+),score=41.27 TRINITY_DN32467_c0_g1_i1:39-1112(+)